MVGKALQADYKKGLSAAICQYIVEKSGLAKTDFGTAEHWFADMGTIELHGDVYTLVGGVDAATGKTVRIYLYRDEVLYSVAANGFDSEMSEMDYRSFKSGHRFQYTSDDFSNKVKIYRPENYTWKISY